MSPRLPGLVAALAMLAAGPASAADLPLWELGLGVAGLSLPHYRGAEKSTAWLLPVPYAVYRGEILRADRDGLRALLFDSDRIDFDLSASATAPADNGDEPARAGMPDLAGTVEFGPNLNGRLARGPGWKLQARLPVRAAFTLESRSRAIGWSVMPHLNLDTEWRGWSFGAQVGWLWGSQRLHAHFYDVAPEFATPTRPVHRARAGHAGWQATLSLSRRDGNRWIGAFVRADSLAGSALRDSPLVRQSNNLSAGVAVSWVLWQSARLVPDPDALR
ncbi:MAG: MipA/OmpV family protein [Rubrivivax sp.]|jgi:outer membrane protein|nr:MipA/OmpV family protein [Rubrivivax sp.]